MNVDNLKFHKEIDDILKDILDLNYLQINPSSDEIRQLILKIKNKYIEVALYEKLSAKKNNGITTNIKDISDNSLYIKLQEYKIILVAIIKKNCNEEEFKKIINEYKLEV